MGQSHGGWVKGRVGGGMWVVGSGARVGRGHGLRGANQSEAPMSQRRQSVSLNTWQVKGWWRVGTRVGCGWRRNVVVVEGGAPITW